MTDAFAYIDSHRDHFLAELQTYLRIPSISTLSEHKDDVRKAAEWTADKLREAGMTAVKIYETPGHPIVYGAWEGAPGAPTVLVYGHYDVQPVDPLNEWHSSPFDPVVRDGNLYARGSSDDKGQVFANIKAVQTLMQANGGKLPVNIKFLVEGEEEIGSMHLDSFIEGHKDLLRSDVALISDTAILRPDQPSIVYALRGLVYMEIHVYGPDHDLHSGQFGGSVHNPLQALSEIITALHNPDGSVAVEGFYDSVRPVDDAERAAIAKTPYLEEAWRQQTGAPQPWGEPSYSLRERVSARPTLEVNGLLGGFTGEGAKTVLPAKAMAKVSCRLVADQDPYEIEKLVRAHVQKLTSPTVRSEVRGLNYGYPAIVPLDSPAVAAAAYAYERGFGVKPVYLREGGSIPVVATFYKTFGIPVLLVGFGLPDDGAHGPNEKFNLDCLYKGIATQVALLEQIGKTPVEQLKMSNRK